MDTRILPEALLGLLGDVTAWTVAVQAVQKPDWPDRTDPLVMPAAALTAAAYDTGARRLTITAGGRTFTYAMSSSLELRRSRDSSPDLIHSIRLINEPLAGCDGMGGYREEPHTLCVEFVNLDRRQEAAERQEARRRADEHRHEAERKANAAREAESVRKMGAIVIPTLERLLVGKRIRAIGVDWGTLVISCDDGTTLQVRTREHQAITCGDIEIDHLRPNLFPGTEVRKRGQ